MKNYRIQLSKNAIFTGVSSEFIEEKIIPYGQIKQYHGGEQIIGLQDTVTQIGILLTGRVQILELFPNGSKSLLSILTPPQMIGIDLIYTKTAYSPYYAITTEETSVFYLHRDFLFSSDIIGEEMSNYFIRRILMVISHDNMKKHYRLAILANKGLRDRIVTYLHMQSNRKQTKMFYIPFSREELADYLCVNRSRLSHELKLMEKEGLIEFRKNHFHLLPDFFKNRGASDR